MRLLLLTLFAALAVAAPAQAATVSVSDGTLRVIAGPGEENHIEVAEHDENGFYVRDGGVDPSRGPGCEVVDLLDLSQVHCPGTVDAVRVEGGDGDDTVTLSSRRRSLLLGGAGDDRITGGDGRDSIDAGSGRDAVDGGSGPDRLRLRDRKSDSAYCGPGSDRIRAEVLDFFDYSCERVTYGPSGRVGRFRRVTGGGRFVRVPGQYGTRIDRRLLGNVLYLIRRYRIRLGDCYAPTGHNPNGEHPLGLACDIYPGPGGSWRMVDRLAKWAEPRPNRPRYPFRWVGYNGDAGHGRGHHLHLSWDHGGGRPRRPVRSVWVWSLKRGAGASLASGPLMGDQHLTPAHRVGEPDV